MKNDDMGKGKVSKGGGSLTQEDFEYLAKQWNMSVEETKKNVLRMLKEEFKSE